MKADTVAVRSLCRVYGIMLRVYPRDFRLRNAGEMAQVFRTACRQRSRARDLRGLLRVVLVAAADWPSSVTNERLAALRAGSPETVRPIMLALLGSSAAMMALRVSAFGRIVRMPGGLSFVLEAAVALIAYGIVVVWATVGDTAARRMSLAIGTALGAAGGGIQIIHLLTESSIDFGRLGNGVSAFGLLFCTFALWAIAAYRVARKSGNLASGVVVGCWAAIVTMSLMVAFGFLFEFYLVVPKPEYVATWGEFQRSGWTDVRAFTVVNTLDAAVSHLIIGPVAGAIFGALGAVFATFRGGGADSRRRGDVSL